MKYLFLNIFNDSLFCYRRKIDLTLNFTYKLFLAVEGASADHGYANSALTLQTVIT